MWCVVDCAWWIVDCEVGKKRVGNLGGKKGSDGGWERGLMFGREEGEMGWDGMG